MGKLNPLQVRNLKEPGRYSDGDGLTLEVRPGGSKSWIARLQANGRRRDHGPGSFKDISLLAWADQVRSAAIPRIKKQMLNKLSACVLTSNCSGILRPMR